MMMGAGLLFMLLIGLVVIGVPVLLAILVGGGLAALLRPRSTPPDVSPVEPASMRKCPTCGRGVKAGWNVCPTCGAALM